MKKLMVGVFSILMLLLTSGYAATPSEVGIVFLHGKGGNPNFHILEKFTSKMSEKGYEVIVPKFPWGGSKGKADYSGSLDDAFKVLDQEISKLKELGRKKIILAGHSMGTPVAIAYLSKNPSVDGVIGIAPGHFVGSTFHDKFVYFDVKKARKAVESGAGGDPLRVEDYNSGRRRFQMDVKAKDYLSFFDPDGPMNFASSLQKMGSTPFLWIAPDADPVTKSGMASDYFSKAPKTPKSKFIEIEAEHINAPVKGIKEIHQWILDL
jgi:pimeloyl-ACP methyl ester carboxylesterase